MKKSGIIRGAVALCGVCLAVSMAHAQGYPTEPSQEEIMRNTRRMMRGMEERQQMAEEFTDSMLDEMSPKDRREYLAKKKQRARKKKGKKQGLNLSGMNIDRAVEAEPPVTLEVKRERMVKALRVHLVRDARLERIEEVAGTSSNQTLLVRAKVLRRTEARRYARLSMRLDVLEVKP